MITPTAIRGNNRLDLHVKIRCGSLSVTAPLSFLANVFDVRRVLHRHTNLAVVNHICVFPEIMSVFKNLTIH